MRVQLLTMFCDANGYVALICGCRCEPRITLLNVALSESFYGVGWTLCSLANCLTHEWESIYCRARTCLLLCLTTSRPALFGVTNKSQKRYIGSILTGVVRSSFPFVGSPRGHAFIVMAVLTFYQVLTFRPCSHAQKGNR